MSFESQISKNSVFNMSAPLLNAQKDFTSLKKKKIASRSGNELFIAFENIIRCSEISTNHTNYKILDLDINFVIEQIEINRSGSLLAIIGDGKLVVCTLPAPGFMSKNPDSSLYVKSFSVGSLIFEKTKILKILWNEIAKYDSHLVVLSDDKHIRSFDLSVSSKQPQFSYNLIENENSVSSPISIAFGSSADPIGAFTLYIITEASDIYALCPFTPPSIAVTKEFVEDFFNTSSLLVQNFKNYSSESGLKRNSIIQLQYATDLWKQLPTAQKDVNISTSEISIDDLFILNPKEQTTKTKLQGPFSIIPSLDKIAKAKDIVTTDCGGSTLVFILLSDSSFLTLLQDRVIVMQWEAEENPDYQMPSRGFGYVDISITYDDDEDIEFFTSLSLLEHTQLSSALKFLNFVGSSLPYIFFIVHEDGVVKVDITSWAETLKRSISTGNVQEFISLLDKPLETETEELSNREFNQNEVEEGVAILIDPVTEDRYIVNLTNRKHEITRFEKQIIGAPKAIKDTEKDVKSKEILAQPYESLLNGPFSEITALLSLLNNNASYKLLASSTSNIEPNENTLNDLNTVSQDIVKKVISLHKVGVSLFYRANLQQKELRQQITKLREIKDTVETLKKKDNVEETIKSLVAKQQGIQTKAAKILNKLSQNRKEMPISEEEKSWFKEINRLNKYLNETDNKNGLVHKISFLSTQLTYIKSQLQTSGSIDTSENKYDFVKLGKYLEEENKLIRHTTSLLNDTMTKIEVQLEQLSMQ